jgi:hypothetical protein
MNTLMKNVFKADCIESFDAHNVQLKEGYERITVPGTEFTSYNICQSEEDLIRSNILLNHYRLQSKEYWINSKMKRGDIKQENAEMYLNYEYFENLDKISNNVIDTELYQKHRVIYDTIDEH